MGVLLATLLISFNTSLALYDTEVRLVTMMPLSIRLKVISFLYLQFLIISISTFNVHSRYKSASLTNTDL